MIDEEAPQKPADAAAFRVREGLWILFVALLVALCIRALVLEGFRIPTESMEKSLLAGDFVLVSKLHYGPRLPMSVGVPLTGWYLEDARLPYVRLPGFTGIQRGDAVVFNYPAESGLVDRKMHYIKRVVGLPGDSVEVRRKELYVNGVHVPLGEAMQQRWIARPVAPRPVSLDTLRALGATQLALLGRQRDEVSFEATRAVADRVAAWHAVDGVEPYLKDRQNHFGRRIFPPGSGFDRDHYGPLYVPARGDTLTLTVSNWLEYRDLIVRFEHHAARLLPNNMPEIDGVQTTQYVVEQDYFFVLGDNRDSSVDSRVWGFVPMDHIVGKAVFIYFSWDVQLGSLRAERLFKGIP